MCAINGFNFKDERLVREMVKVTSHRGPDQEGYFCDESVSLGSARLSIIDLSEKGCQPIWNEDKSICVILNGEIYNFKELRERCEKSGHRFFSNTDTEVIIHLYEDYGAKCLDFLNGIFAFAIWDKSKQEIFLARDRVGVKPLYYYFDGKVFIFSSEIKAILEHPISRSIDHKALALYFKMSYVPGPLTMFHHIFKLQPAHYLVYRDDCCKVSRYWQIEDAQSHYSFEIATEKVKELMRDSIKGQLVADRPVGVFLSGGVDSTSVLGVASEFATPPIKTYSVGFAGRKLNEKVFEDKFNRDFYLARKTSKLYGTNHHELIVSDADARDNFEKAIWHMDEPVSNPTAIPRFLIAKEARKEVVVVLGGDGGDELFGGYSRYSYSRLLDKYQLLPKFLREYFLSPLAYSVLKKRGFARKLMIPKSLDRYIAFMAENPKALQGVLRPEIFNDMSVVQFLKAYCPPNRYKDFTKYLMYLDFSMWLPDESLLQSDKMTMAHGLEERVPILDHRLIELAFSLPIKWKVGRGNNNKLIFREAMKDYISASIASKDKRGWFSPASMWLRGAMRGFTYDVLAPDYCDATKDYFDFPVVKDILDKHVAGTKYNMPILWSLLTFQIWYKKFLS